METSDSECFESADEIQSEDEEINVKFNEKLTSNNKTISKKSQLKDLGKTVNTFKLEKETEDLSNKNVFKVTISEKPVKKSSDEHANSTRKLNKEFKIDIGKGKKKLINPSSKTKYVCDNILIKKIEADKSNEKDNIWDDEEIDWASERVVEEQVSKDTKKEDQEEEGANLWLASENWENVNTNYELTISGTNFPSSKATETKFISSSYPISSSGWGSWGNWDVSSIINTATNSVSTLTSQVSQGISTVLESGIGVPDPEELAKINKEEDEKYQQLKQVTEMQNNDKNEFEVRNAFGFVNLVSGVTHLTKLVESTSTKVISGGLDTLETIGKKTMEVLQEGDPGLKKKRAFLKLDKNKPILSQVLREAKEKSDNENKKLEERHMKKNLKNYETLFDDHQGLVHLEALEMLSKQCFIKLQNSSESLSGDASTELQETMDQIKELCELPDEDEEEKKPSFVEMKDRISKAIKDIDVQISYIKLINIWMESEKWLDNLILSIYSDSELHQQGIDTLAQLTAIAVEQFHKAGELLLVKDHRSTADEADSLVQLTTILTSIIGIMADKFSDKLIAKALESGDKDGSNALITNIYLEAANSSSYIQDAFKLLIPVLQVGAI